MTSSLSPVFTSHAQPEPKRVLPAVVELFLELRRTRRSRVLIASARLPTGLPPRLAGGVEDLPEQRVVVRPAAVVADGGLDLVLHHREVVRQHLVQRLAVELGLLLDRRRCSC